MSFRKLQKPSKDVLAFLLRESTNDDVAQRFGVGRRTIQRWRDSYGLSHANVRLADHEMTQFQKDLLIGCLLGDGSIRWMGNPEWNNRFSFKQTRKRREYVEFVYESLLPYSSRISDGKPRKGPIRVNGEIKNNVGKEFQETVMYTMSCSEFSEMRKKWYAEPDQKNSAKIVPDIELNWTVLSYWFADDGCNNKSRRTITFSTQCFSEANVDKLVNMIQRDLLIVASRRNWGTGPVVVIGSKYYDVVMSQFVSQLQHLSCLSKKLNYTPKKIDDSVASVSVVYNC